MYISTIPAVKEETLLPLIRRLGMIILGGSVDFLGKQADNLAHIAYFLQLLYIRITLIEIGLSSEELQVCDEVWQMFQPTRYHYTKAPADRKNIADTRK